MFIPRQPRFGQRLSRRRVIRTLGAGGLVLAGAACSTPVSTIQPTAGAASAPTSAPTGASATAAPVASQTTAPPPPKRGGTFRTNVTTSPPHYDPHLTNNVIVFGYGIGLCYSRLLKFKLRGIQLPASIPVGDAAESWTQPDDLTYIFKLRPNIKFANVAPVNGRPLVVDDIIYSYERQKTGPNAAYLAAITKMEAVDRSTLKLTTGTPSADFLLNVAQIYSPIVAKEAVELKGDLKEGPLVGTGPFIVEKLDPNGASTARRNPDFYMTGQPYIDAYELVKVQDAATRLAAFRTGNSDLITQGNITVPDLEAMKKTNPNILVQMVRGLNGTELGLKQTKPPFNDMRVRQAIYKAIDPRVIIDTAFGSGWFTVGIPLPSAEWAIPQDEITRIYKRDLDGAKKLMADAGQASGFDMAVTVADINPAFVPAAELIAQQLKDINIRMTLKRVDFATYGQLIQVDGAFDAYLGSGAAGSTDSALLGRYHSKGSGNVTGINDPTLDGMIERQATLGRNPDARKALLLDIQRRILDQGYVRNFHSWDSPVVLQPYVRDYFTDFGNLSGETDKWVELWLDK
jgi:peptide/nickel transport system substrate-binding protein